MGIRNLELYNFRNHRSISIDVGADFVQIIGANGSGKTNILEALSLFSPGRGLRAAMYKEMVCNQFPNDKWAVATNIDGDELRILNRESSTKIIQLNGVNTTDRKLIVEFFRVIWLTPSQDEVLSESNSVRKRFFDRITFNFFPAHATLLNRHDAAVRSRNKLLEERPVADPWFDTYEQVIAESSISILQNRIEALSLLNKGLERFKSSFIKPQIELDCRIATLLSKCSREQGVEKVRDMLFAGRANDKLRFRTSVGAHKTIYNIANPLKDIDIKYSSTGEKKGMLISIVLAQAQIIKQSFDGQVVLLLDDIFSHLDKSRVEELLKELINLQVQSFITATTNVLGDNYEGKINIHI